MFPSAPSALREQFCGFFRGVRPEKTHKEICELPPGGEHLGHLKIELV